MPSTPATKPLLNRRTLLSRSASAALSVPMLGAGAALSGGAQAAAPMLGVSTPAFRRFKLGDFEVTALLAGTRTVDNPHGIFGLNVSAEDFAAVSAEAKLPTDAAQFFFTPTVVNTGRQLILFDTGFNGAALVAGLSAAGYSADQVDVVVITHMHGDHIGGLMNAGKATFPNASYVTNALEYDAMAANPNDGFTGNVEPLAEQMRFIGGGDSVASGITAVAAYGHSPGHTTFMLESDGRQLLLAADLANHYVYSLAYPDWEVRFDRDKEAAAQSRRTILGMLAADGVPMLGYHMPFPGVGYVETRGEGFHYTATSYQLML